MPVFRYQGIDQKGKKTSGVVDAENERAARTKLRRTNIYPTTVVAEGGRGSMMMAGKRDVTFGSIFQRVKMQDIAMMTRQFASLLSAGIPLVETLAALGDQMESPKLKTAITGLKERVTEGEKLSSAMLQYPLIFNSLFVNMVSAGESSGMLESVLERIADVSESQAKLKSKVVGALTYPAIMGCVGLLMMILLMTFVIPKITTMLIEMGGELPMITKVMIGASNFMLGWWWLLLLMTGLAIFLFRKWVNSAKGRYQFHKILLRAPLVGKLILLTNIARLTRTLGTLLQSGVPMLGALDIVINIVDNLLIKDALQKAREAVKEGASLADPLKQSGLFPNLTVHMIATGEKTGDLEKMLERVADNYETQVDNTVGSLMGLMEPAMIIMMAGVVGLIAVSVILPMLQASGGAV